MEQAQNRFSSSAMKKEKSTTVRGSEETRKLIRFSLNISPMLSWHQLRKAPNINA